MAMNSAFSSMAVHEKTLALQTLRSDRVMIVQWKGQRRRRLLPLLYIASALTTFRETFRIIVGFRLCQICVVDFLL